MHRDAQFIPRRLDRFITDRLRPAIYSHHTPLTISAWQAPGEPVSFAEATAQAFTEVSYGWRFGRAWSTTWLRVEGSVPDDWREDMGVDEEGEILVDFGYNRSRSGFQAEGLAYTREGEPIKSIAPLNSWLPWPVTTPRIDVLIEVAANPDVAGDYTFAPTPFGQWETAPETPLYELRELHLARRHRTVWEWWQDLWVLRGLIDTLPENSTRRHTILRGVEDMLDAVDPADVRSFAAAGRAIIAPLMAVPAVANGHRILATGHAHIDSAWLWPLRETVRKCARTFTNVLDLMASDPEFVFSCSSAQQYAWMKDHYPAVFQRIIEAVKTGQWVPVGGMWVESDTNMPGSEAMVRQFVYGQRFFKEHFGRYCREAWLPDSFGYSGSLPQIVSGAGISWFLSQKMSWNQINPMPHHTFFWEGIDGSRVFTHFPPADTYISELSPAELRHAESNFSEKGRASMSLVPFGWGDGGGGPTREMIAAAHRSRDLDGVPRVVMGSPEQFFTDAEADYKNPPVWRGEMYLELHRGVLTSQRRTKQGNRRSEALLREAELWATTATIVCQAPYPAEQLRSAWETVLLLQFHDILPGSSIAWVHREAEARYDRVTGELTAIIDQALRHLTQGAQTTATPTTLAANSSSRHHAGVSSMAIAQPTVSDTPVEVTSVGDYTTLDNGHLSVTVDQCGRIVSLITHSDGRDMVPSGQPANVFWLHHDTPTLWDAWDLDEHYRHNSRELDTVSHLGVEQVASGAAAVTTVREWQSTGRPTSRITQTLTLHPGATWLDLEVSVDWHEQEKILKLAFPIDIHCEQVAAEGQFGHVFRPTHTNTSWDFARWEACQHRFVHLAEPGYGVAIANDSTYGFDVGRTTEESGHTTTTVRLSLLRAPLFPDPDSDQGHHHMRFRIQPGATIADAVHLGHDLALPLRELTGHREVPPLVSVNVPEVVIETVKLAEDGSGDVIIRAYEATGARVQATITVGTSATSCQLTDLLEEPLEGHAPVPGNQVSLDCRPFRVFTLRCSGVTL